MNPKVMVFAIALCTIGLALFIHGSTLSNQILNPENMISGTFFVVIGIFISLAGLLMLLLSMFQGRSLSY